MPERNAIVVSLEAYRNCIRAFSDSQEKIKAAKELEAKALRRFEPRPQAGETSKEQVLGEVFSEQDIQALAAKAERREREKKKALPPASDHDPEFGE